jgi:hypothetical protein|uniref:Uncharacterized protein n=1 Tax=viral metagenome TaxID=1070528 RepID=A0A6C0HDU5_9ZZZZ
MSFHTLKESYMNGTFTNQEYYDQFPFRNWWRQDPFSDKAIIRANVAGYYPYKSDVVVQKPEDPPYEYAYYYACSTIFPKSPGLVKSKDIIHQP